jgi:hypothetical protein
MRHALSTFGLYPTSHALFMGAAALRAARFRQTDISVLYSDGHRALRLRDASPLDSSTAETGDECMLADLLTTFSGHGAVLMPRDGAYLAAGPILATVSDSGSLLSSLRGLGLPDSELESFEQRLRQGFLLLSVECDDEREAAEARRIFEQTGAERIAASGPASPSSDEIRSSRC